MSKIQVLPERFLRSDAEFTLFWVGEMEVKTRLLGCAEAEAWVESVREYDVLVIKVQEAFEALRTKGTCSEEDRAPLRELQKARFKLCCDGLRNYNGGTPFTDEIVKTATPAQLQGAFELLKTHNDPLCASVVLAQAYIEEAEEKRGV